LGRIVFQIIDQIFFGKMNASVAINFP